jgi:SAM-dependent methyltransferase
MSQPHHGPGQQSSPEGGDPDAYRETYEARRTAFGGGQPDQVTADEYDAVRPDWRPATMTWLLGSPAPGRPLDVVDLGAGTGKGTRTLAALGHTVIAVEPSAGMRATLQRSLADVPNGSAARVDVCAGDAERLPLPDRSVDAVVALQAWHWFDQTAAERECARVLRPGGWLAMAWHHRNESLPWARELSETVRITEHIRGTGGTGPAPGNGTAGSVDTGDPEVPVLSAAFDPPETVLLHFVMRQSVDDLVRHAGTWSFVAVAPDRELMLQRVRAVARSRKAQPASTDGSRCR